MTKILSSTAKKSKSFTLYKAEKQSLVQIKHFNNGLNTELTLFFFNLNFVKNQSFNQICLFCKFRRFNSMLQKLFFKVF